MAIPPIVQAFFHEATFTQGYVSRDANTQKAAIIDDALNFDQPAGFTSLRNRPMRSLPM